MHDKNSQIEFISYGTEDGGKTWFVQSCCIGDCKIYDCNNCSNDCYGENFTKHEAISMAITLSRKFHVPWGELTTEGKFICKQGSGVILK